MIDKLLKKPVVNTIDIPQVETLSIDKILLEIETDAAYINKNKLNLDDVSLGMPNLHAKYSRWHALECLALRNETIRLKVIKNELWEFLVTGTHNEYSTKYGWTIPTDQKGKVLKTEAPYKIDTNKEVIDQTIKIGIIEEKVQLLENQLKNITSIRYDIKNAIDVMRWKSGD